MMGSAGIAAPVAGMIGVVEADADHFVWASHWSAPADAVRHERQLGLLRAEDLGEPFQSVAAEELRVPVGKVGGQVEAAVAGGKDTGAFCAKVPKTDQLHIGSPTLFLLPLPRLLGSPVAQFAWPVARKERRSKLNDHLTFAAPGYQFVGG